MVVASHLVVKALHSMYNAHDIDSPYEEDTDDFPEFEARHNKNSTIYD